MVTQCVDPLLADFEATIEHLWPTDAEDKPMPNTHAAQRFTGSFSIADTNALTRALGMASESQLRFWLRCARKARLQQSCGLIIAELVDRQA
jgi:hypothetical protein